MQLQSLQTRAQPQIHGTREETDMNERERAREREREREGALKAREMQNRPWKED
jgi:hypothetical protein